MSDKPVRLTEDDWIRPLALVRGLADQRGLALTDSQEQRISLEIVQGVTLWVAHELDGIAAAVEVVEGSA